METTGRVRNGVVVLDNRTGIPEGAVVKVVVLDNADTAPTLAELFADVAGKAVGLPPDMAENHDFYLHGLPKKNAS